MTKPEFSVACGDVRRGYGHMVHGYYVQRLLEVRRRREERLARVKCEATARSYVRDVRARIAECFGGEWPERTPLNARVTGRLRGPGCRIEKIEFESQPGCPVTANLYLPERIEAPLPAVLLSCGHVDVGKAEPRYQACCQRLVQAGFAVLIYDPLNQGERDQYLRLPSDARIRRNCCLAHNMMGKQMLATGDFIGRWMAWDGMRALDYLCARAEIDPSRIGVTGNSGGGTLSGYLLALDDRVSMAAISCWIASFLSNLESELPTDAEQCPPGALARELDHVDFAIAGAPKPALLIGQRFDWFDVRALRAAFGEAQHVYRRLGAEDRVALFVGAHDHGFHPDAQAAMVSFFCRHAKVQEPRETAEPVAMAPADLRCTAGGQILAESGTPVPVPVRVAGRARALVKARRKRTPDQVRRDVADVLGVRIPIAGAPRYTNLMLPQVTPRGVHVRCAVETEPGIQVLLHRFAPALARSIFEVEEDAHLVVPHVSAELEWQGDPITRDLAAGPGAFLVDLRGLGESMPDEPQDFFFGYGMDYTFQGCGLLLGESYVGRRVFDLLRVIDLLCAEGARRVHLHGRGQGALAAVFAAAVRADGIASVHLREYPESLFSLVEALETPWPAAFFPYGILRVCDIPDLLPLIPFHAERNADGE